MDYFRLSQDKRYLNPPFISNLNDIVKRRSDTTYGKASIIPDINVGFAKPDNKIDFIDVLDEQIYMIKEEISTVFKMYEPALLFKSICILNNITGEYGSYQIPIFQELDCLSPNSIISPDKTYIKKLVLSKVIPEELAIFKVSNLCTDVVVIRLDVAESLLRREIVKFSLKRIERDD